MRRKTILLSALFTCLFGSSLLADSPWVQQPTYAKKVSHKLEYGLKNILFGWTVPFTEPFKEKFRTDTHRRSWYAFSVGVARGVMYTANGLIQTATFPIPIDFIDMGDGVQHPAITNKQPYGLALVERRALRDQAGYGDNEKISTFPTHTNYYPD